MKKQLSALKEGTVLFATKVPDVWVNLDEEAIFLLLHLG